jgi:hypothetical protein
MYSAGRVRIMFQNYEDILSRIAEPPRWFDEEGVPRYCEFAPHRIANIYADECALLAIECQSCGRPFVVALDAAAANRRTFKRSEEWRTLADIIRSHEIHYGDPPTWTAAGSGTPRTAYPAACSNTGSASLNLHRPRQRRTPNPRPSHLDARPKSRNRDSGRGVDSRAPTIPRFWKAAVFLGTRGRF